MHTRKHVKWLLTLAVCGSTLLMVAGINLLAPAAVAAGEDCNQCHEEVATQFQNSFHGRAWTGTGSASGCQSCHGSAERHQNDPSRETIITFGKNSLQSAEEQSQLCIGCHDTSANLAFWEMGAHQSNDVRCTDCHSIHTGKNAVRQPETCEGCHRSIKTQINKQSHHPIVEGKVKCSDCHNPHGTLAKSMLRAENTNQLCYTCHADKRGPFIWEHTPVEEDCSICHAPHGSRYDKLLTQRVPNLCHDCHADRRHHDGPYDATTGFIGGSASEYSVGRSCLNCHSRIHGSTYFQKVGFTK